MGEDVTWGVLRDSLWRRGLEVLPKNLCNGRNGTEAKGEQTRYCSIIPFKSLALQMMEFALSGRNPIHPRDRVIYRCNEEEEEKESGEKKGETPYLHSNFLSPSPKNYADLY